MSHNRVTDHLVIDSFSFLEAPKDPDLKIFFFFHNKYIAGKNPIALKTYKTEEMLLFLNNDTLNSNSVKINRSEFRERLAHDMKYCVEIMKNECKKRAQQFRV